MEDKTPRKETSIAQRLIRLMLVMISVIFTIAILDFITLEKLSLPDAVFSVFTIFMTGDPGSLHYDHANPVSKMLASLLMVVGALSLAIAIGLLADLLLSTRLDQMLGKKLIKMENHIILAGLGQTGIRIFEELQHFGDSVVVLEADETEFTHKARKEGGRVILGDLHSPAILEEAQIETAKSLIVATDDDLINVEIAINAKELQPELNIVLKMFDQRLAKKLQEAFGIRAAFSATALAAPAFAAASHCDSVLDSIHLEDKLLVTAEIEVGLKTDLSKLNFTKLAKEMDFTILQYTAKGRQPQLHPKNLTNFSGGDKFVLVCTLEALERIQELNKQSA